MEHLQDSVEHFCEIRKRLDITVGNVLGVLQCGGRDHRCGSGTACLPSTCEALSLIPSTIPTRKQTWEHKGNRQNSSIVIRKGSVFEFPMCFNRAAIFYGKNVLILSLFWRVFKSFSSIPILSVSIFLCLSVSFSLNFRRSLWRYAAEYHKHCRQGCHTEENKSQKRKDGYMGTCFPQIWVLQVQGPWRRWEKPIKWYIDGLLTILGWETGIITM